MSLQKTYQYQIFNSSGVYLGLLPNVVSEFGYNQNINTVGAQLQITVAQTADIADQSVAFLADEFGDPITTEGGGDILLERQPDIVGAYNSNNLINNNNLIKVYEFSNYYPNGLLVFQGYISKWKAVFGNDNNIIVTCLSNGGDLNNYLVLGSATADQTQNSQNNNVFLFLGSGGKNSGWNLAGQTFTTGVGVTSISAIAVWLAGNSTADEVVTLNLWNSPNDYFTVPPQASVSVVVPKNATAQLFTFTFATPVTVAASTQYFFTVDPADNNGFNIYYNSSHPYGSGGIMWYNFYSGGSGGGTWQQTPAGIINTQSDLYFITYYTAGATNSTFTNQDVSTIMTSIIQSYNSRGGLLQIPGGGYSATTVLTTYTFKVQTILQAIQTLLTQAPSNWYFYGDPATNSLVFSSSNYTTPNVTLVKGRHINDLELEATKEGIKNNAYFTGGDDGTGTSTNIFVNETVALNGNRVGLSLLSDNRVSAAGSGSKAAAQGIGRAIALANLQQNQSETYVANVTIQDQTMDINLIKLGQTIGFAGFGNFIDNLVLQIVGVNRQPDQVQVQIGTLPKRVSKTVSDIQTALAYLQTVANPSTAS